MYRHHLDDASQQAQCSGATQTWANNRPCRAGHSHRSAGPCQAPKNAGSQVVLVLFDPSSLIHLAPIPAMTCFPSFTAKSPFPGHPHRDYYLSCLSWTVTISPVYSGSIFLPRSFITSTLSIQSLAYFLFFQLTLQLPGRIFGYSLPFICLLAISPALPTSQIYPWPCL